MPTLSIREATPEDSAAIAGVQVRAWQWAYRKQLPDALLDGMSVEQRTEVWGQILGRDRQSALTWVAELDGMPIGFASAGHCRDTDMPSGTGELYAVYLAEEQYTRHSVGTMLFVEASNFLRGELDCSSVTAWVVETNIIARNFYESLGFRPDGATQRQEESGATWTEVRYSMEL